MVKAGAVSSVHQTFIEHFLSTSYCLRQQRIMTNMEQSLIPRCFFLLEEKFHTIEFLVLMWYIRIKVQVLWKPRKEARALPGVQRSLPGGAMWGVLLGEWQLDLARKTGRAVPSEEKVPWCCMEWGARKPSAVLEQSSEGDWGAEGGATGMVTRALDVMLRSLDSSLSRAMRRAKKVKCSGQIWVSDKPLWHGGVAMYLQNSSLELGRQVGS